jgi:hypothetical protein
MESGTPVCSAVTLIKSSILRAKEDLIHSGGIGWRVY